MGKKEKVCLNISLLFLIQNGVCMDPPTGSPSSSGWFYSSGTSASSSWTFNPLTVVTSVASSLTATVHNKLSDNAALRKLGFPSNDPYACTELESCNKIYKDILATKNNDDCKIYLERILRRTEYLTRIFSILPTRPDFHEVILHCTNNHSQAMSVSLKNCYDTFLAEKLTLYTQLSEDMKQLNTSQGNKQKLSVSTTLTNVDPLSLQITIPTLSGAAQFLCDSASSLYNTAKNELSDYAAFKKLGWPINDPDAQLELRVTSDCYAKIATTTQHQKRIELLFFALRRAEYLVRAFLALPHRPDSFELAQFLVRNHQKAMFPLLLTLFTRFTTNQHKAVELASNQLLKNSGPIMIKNKIDFNFGTKNTMGLQELSKTLGNDCLVVLKQNHGITGCVITDDNYRMDLQKVMGDFLVTNKPGVRLGILTADCLPIIFHDKKNSAVGIAHAGWKGSVGNIVNAIFASMSRNYNTQASDLAIIFGPCIHPCCYNVDKTVIDRVSEHNLADKTIINRDDMHFFDLLAFNKALLIKLGVNESSIDISPSKCTQCNTEYHSHRRRAQPTERQLSYVWIKK